MRDTITRTFIKNIAVALLCEGREISEKKIAVPAAFNTTALAEKYLRKHDEDLDGKKLAAVESIETIETLYGMSESQFIKLAKPVDARSKDTRGMVSKTVVGKRGTLLYMDKARKVHDMPVVFSKDEKTDKVIKRETPTGYKGIAIEDIEDTETLYVMTEQEFIENSREMVDHQHYKMK